MNPPQHSPLKTKSTGIIQAAANKQGINSKVIKDNRTKKTIQKKESNTGLPVNLKSGIENLSGIAMDNVKVHYNSYKPAQLSAHAYAQGTDIHIAPGQDNHLPHEAWHVVQQAQGRVNPTMQMKGKVNINDDKVLEKEADIMGKKAIAFSGSIAQRKYSNNFKSKSITDITVQRTVKRVFYTKAKKKGKQTIEFKNADDLIRFLTDKMPDKQEYLEKNKVALQNFISYGPDHTIEDDPENEELENEIALLLKGIEGYCKELPKSEKTKEETKEDPLSRIKSEFEKEYSVFNERYQAEVRGNKGTNKTGANDPHSSIAQRMIGKAMMDAADACMKPENTKEEKEWLKKQKTAGNTKFTFTGETHHH